MEYKARHQRLWRLESLICRALVRTKFNFSGEMNNIQGPFLVLCNHTTDWDPLFISSTFKNQMYFVASEYVMRMGFASRLIQFFFSPIMRQKGGNAAGTVKAILRTLKDGYNVCLFPEGNRSWDGSTAEFPASTGKLAKTCGATLVTYCISGGYFSSPRWAGKSIRRGKTSGRVTGVYPPEVLKEMTADQINGLIAEGISEDAYARQETEPVEFKGKNTAEHVETMLFACPVCGQLHSLVSAGSKVRCSGCGTEAEYLNTGFLKGGFGFNTLNSWHGWQKKLIEKLCDGADENEIFSDEDVELEEVKSAKETRLLSRGKVSLFRDRLVLPGNITIPGREISGMSILRSSNLFIGTNDGKIYQIRSNGVLCSVKYLLACRKLGFIDSFV